MRYGIIKKRIDKAYVDGSNQRLTLAQHITIAYLHDKDKTVPAIADVSGPGRIH